MRFIEFADFLLQLEQVSSRNQLTEMLAEFYSKLDFHNVNSAFYFLQGRLAPKYSAVEYNFSEKLMIKSLSSKFSSDVSNLFKTLGDVGNVVMELKNQNVEFSQPSLFSSTINSDSTISEVYNELLALASLTGKGSQDQKINKYFELVSIFDAVSAKFLTRIILGDLRLGISEKTILDSLSWYVSGDKGISEEIKYAFGINSDIALVAEKIFQFKQLNTDIPNMKQALMDLSPVLGVPVASKLVERESTPEAVWERMPNCLVQPKLDGLRGQIHFDGDKSYIFSRNLESLTDQFPELTSELQNLGVESIILDSEIIAFDKNTGAYGSYQETMQRRRKYDIEKYADDSPVCAMCFDILYLNGKNLMGKISLDRYQILQSLFVSIGHDSVFKLLETRQVKHVEELAEFFQKSIDAGLEGIIAKEWDSIYEPGTRNFSWIKLKYNAIQDRVDTIDLVVMGYFAGGGNRAQFGFGALLCGVVGDDAQIYCFAKVGSGFGEELMKEIFPLLQNYKVESADSSFVFNKSIKPDAWVAPKLIIEVDADEITRSPLYSVGIGKSTSVKNDDITKGLSLRFPRIKRIRYDRDMPNSVDEVLRMFELRRG